MNIFNLFKNKPKPEPSISKTPECEHVSLLPIVLMSELEHDPKRRLSKRITCHLTTCYLCGNLTEYGMETKGTGTFQTNEEIIDAMLKVAYKSNKRTTGYKVGIIKNKGKVCARLGEDTDEPFDIPPILYNGVLPKGMSEPALLLDWIKYVEGE